ncbi:MAG: ABC transporter permease [Pseudomonadota bacterium]
MAFWREIFSSITALVAGAFIALLLAVSLFGPLLSPHDLETMNWDRIGEGPSLVHWFGTDEVGRDLFVRTMEGLRVSITIALITTAVALSIGIPWGAVAGLSGGYTEQIMMRIVDAIYCIPGLLIIILLVVVFGRNQYLLFAGIGAIAWLDIARIVRGQTLQLKDALYISSARALGANTFYLLRKHVIPNVIGPIVIFSTLMVPNVILMESTISFLGLGIQEPDTSLGVLVSDGTQVMESAPWQLLFPGVVLALMVWSLNTLGDRMRMTSQTSQVA